VEIVFLELQQTCQVFLPLKKWAIKTTKKYRFFQSYFGKKLILLDYQVFDVIWLREALFLSVKIANSLIFNVI